MYETVQSPYQPLLSDLAYKYNYLIAALLAVLIILFTAWLYFTLQRQKYLELLEAKNLELETAAKPVSYTHLDVYKRQTYSTSGMISPALLMTTVSPILISFALIKSSLCSVALLTVLPDSLTGVSTAVGVSTPVRPTWITISSSLV